MFIQDVVSVETAYGMVGVRVPVIIRFFSDPSRPDPRSLYRELFPLE
jgi:hypothetical protein